MRILYVEDQAYLRETIGLLLEQPGREIVSVDSGEAAFEAFKGEPFDLLITDVSLPGVSGLDVARTARKQWPDLWIVLMSGYSFADQIHEFGERSAALTKPFDADQLDELIDRIQSSI